MDKIKPESLTESWSWNGFVMKRSYSNKDKFVAENTGDSIACFFNGFGWVGYIFEFESYRAFNSPTKALDNALFVIKVSMENSSIQSKENARRKIYDIVGV